MKNLAGIRSGSFKNDQSRLPLISGKGLLCLNDIHLFSFYFSREFLTKRSVLVGLFIVNLLGTVYGYEWYANQMVDTIAKKPLWLVFFVPDSPTASLFFTVSLIFLMMDRLGTYRFPLRGLVEALAIITSIKYGIWAVSMIFAGAYLGEPLVWQDWMLVVSHLGMAVEALMFVRFFRYGMSALIVAAIWTFMNDYIDYHFDVFPWLPIQLLDHLPRIQKFTVSLSMISTCVALIYRKKSID